MGKNLVVKEFTQNGSWVCPGGVAQLKVSGLQERISLHGQSILTSAGAAYMWGYNGKGNIGDGSIVAKSSPVAVVGGLNFKSISARNGSTAGGLTIVGKAYCWGEGSSGQIGDGTITKKSSPVAVLGGLYFKKLSLNGRTFAAGMTPSGAAYAWGDNSSGQLGDNSVTSKSSPVAVVGGLVFKDIASGPFCTVGITTSGAAYAWGENTKGELGDGTTVAKSSPVLVLGGLTFTQIEGSVDNLIKSSMIGLTSSGQAYTWGDNSSGQLGDGTTVAKSSPVLVLGGLTFKKVIAGGRFMLGLTTAGTLYAWGRNLYGELGDGTNVHRSSPVLVLGGLTFKDVTASDITAHGLSTSGAVYGWGSNDFYGDIGDGTTTNRSSPVAIVGSLDVNMIDYTFQNELKIRVTPGTTYQIVFANGFSYFNDTTGTTIFKGSGKLVLEYET